MIAAVTSRAERPRSAPQAGGEAIVVQGLGKRFRRRVDRPATLKELLVRGFRRAKDEWFWGLSQVSFAVERGTMLGVVGHNGAGKSTLLRLIGGVGLPDEGGVQTHGRIGALLDLSAGFHPDLSGRENALLAGVIAGLTRKEVLRRFDDIVAFAELEAFIDAPLRTYSSGMSLRLGFSVAAHTDPEILLIDEVLAVGDLAFQRKCIRRIQEIKAAGAAIVLVTHDTEQVKKYCDRALWMSHGKVAGYGPTGSVVEDYTSEMAKVTQASTPTDRAPVTLASGVALRVGDNRFGSLELEVSGVWLRDQRGATVTELDSGEPLVIELELTAKSPIVSPIACVSIENEEHQLCCDTNTANHGLDLGTVSGSRRVRLVLDRLDLAGGEYFVNVSAYERQWSYAYDEHYEVYPLSIRATPHAKGVLAPPHRWELAMPAVDSSAPRGPTQTGA